MVNNNCNFNAVNTFPIEGEETKQNKRKHEEINATFTKIEKKFFLTRDTESVSRNKQLKYRIAHQLSVPNLNELNALRERLPGSHLSGEIWSFENYFPDPLSSGYICRFKIKDQYNPKINPDSCKNFNEKLYEIKPALEPSPRTLYYLFSNFNRNDLSIIDFGNFIGRAKKDMESDWYVKLNGYLNQLGYSLKIEGNSYYLHLPTLEALEQRWLGLQQVNKWLPDLSIASAKGVATDLEFISNYVTHDAMLSCDKEFVHDHVFHLIPTLRTMLFMGTYRYNRNKINVIHEVFQGYKLIAYGEELLKKKDNIGWINELLPRSKMALTKKNIRILLSGLSAVVDIFSSFSEQQWNELSNGFRIYSVNGVKCSNNHMLNWHYFTENGFSIFRDSNYEAYFIKKFSKFKIDQLILLWGDLNEAVRPMNIKKVF